MLYLRNKTTDKIVGPIVGKTSNNGKRYLIVGKQFSKKTSLIEINDKTESQFDIVTFTNGVSK